MPGRDNALIVVASDAAFAQAGKWVSFLQGKTITVQARFAAVISKNSKTVRIYASSGLPRRAARPGHSSRRSSGKAEQDWVIQQGNRKLYVKENVFAKDQTIFRLRGVQHGSCADGHTGKQGRMVGNDHELVRH